MTEGQEFRGRSTAEAAIAASEALGVTRSEVEFRVISETGAAFLNSLFSDIAQSF